MEKIMQKNLYELLGTREDADIFEIRDAAQERANEINRAFKTLSNPETRTAYDAQLKQKKLEKKEWRKSLITLKIALISAFQWLLVFSILALLLWGVAWLLPNLRLPRDWYSDWYEYRYIPALGVFGVGFLLAFLRLSFIMFKRAAQ
jgi:curved DNA-binding protein CbpA